MSDRRVSGALGAWAASVAFGWLVACSLSEPPSASKAIPVAPQSQPALLATASAEPASADTEPRDRCTAAGDCVLSCAFGAVNGEWYRRVLPSGDPCEDGCSSKGMTVDCSAGHCVAIRNGVLVPECTAVKKPVAAPR